MSIYFILRNYRARDILVQIRGEKVYFITIDKPLLTIDDDNCEYYIYLRPIKSEGLIYHKKLGYIIQNNKNPIVNQNKVIENKIIGYYTIENYIKLITKEVLNAFDKFNNESMTINIKHNKYLSTSMTIYKEDIPMNSEYFYLNIIKEIRLFNHPLKLDLFSKLNGKPITTTNPRDMMRIKLFN